jgi:hypothetical protein
MAPAQSKHAAPIQPEITAPRKRKASSKITDENFVGAESNVVTKRLKQSADAARDAAEKRQQRQPSVQDLDPEDEDTVPLNNTPKNPRAVLEAANGSDDVEMLDNDPAPPHDSDEDDMYGPEVAKPIETAEEQRSESITKCCQN